MINLLPVEEKNRIALEGKKRLTIILWCFASLLVFFLILILFSAKSYLKDQLDYQKNIFENSKNQIGQSEIQDIQKKFESFNSSLLKLDSFYKKRASLSDILIKISNMLPKDSYLTDLSLVYDENNNLKATLAGFVATRESLFEFKKNIEKESWVGDISFPSSNWVEPKNINFSLSFKIAR